MTICTNRQKRRGADWRIDRPGYRLGETNSAAFIHVQTKKQIARRVCRCRKGQMEVHPRLVDSESGRSTI
jgi:hypothetical protein